MYEDDPQEKVFDVLGEAVFGEHPLGRAVIGRAEVIADTPADEIVAFHHARYTPQNIVIAAAGAIDHDALVAMARERVPEVNGLPPVAIESLAAAGLPASRLTGRRFERKDTEQFHVCVGGIGISRHDERRYALRVLDTIFGGTSSSRLFQEVRERRGLAYSVFSFASQYQETGQVGLYVGTRGENLVEALAVIGAEIRRLGAQAVSEEELQRAKENLKGRVLLALESTGARMNSLGNELLAGGELIDLDELEARIDAVTAADLAALAGELWDPERLAVAGIGPDEELFARAAATLRPAEAAA